VDLLTSKLPPGFPVPDGFRLHALMKSWGGLQFLTLVLSIWRLRPDAVLLIYIDWIYECNPMITFLPAVFRRLRPGMPIVTQFENESGLTAIRPPNGMKVRLLNWFLKELAGRRGLHPIYGALLRDSRRVIALSERHLEAFERAQPGVSNKAQVIPAPPIMRFASETMCAARKRGRALLGLSDQDMVLVYFGYVYSMKGVETLLSAFGSLPVSTRLIVIGDGEAEYLSKLQELSKQVGGAERVIWTGHCKPEEEFASLYLYAADICVLPFNDGVRLNNSSFAVAASHGLPIVTTRGESLEVPFLDGHNVRLCPPKDPDALAAAIGELICSPATRHKLASGARGFAETHFSWDRVIQSTLEVLSGSTSLEKAERTRKSNA
jgi:glycosyltransferase involved in cell wall biosynthesis